MLKGYLASTDRKLKEAIEYFRQALQADSSNAGVVTELASLLMRDGQVQEGEKLALDLIAQKTSYGPAYDLMYSFYLNANRPRGRRERPTGESESQSEERRLRPPIGAVLQPSAQHRGNEWRLAASAKRSQGFSRGASVGR